MMRELAWALVIALLATPVSAQSSQAYDITQHAIQVGIDEQGNAQVTEQFFLYFPQEFYRNQFKAESENNGISLSAWRQFDARIHTYIGDERNLVGARVSFIEDRDKYLELTYSLKTPVMNITSDTSRRTDFKLKENAFREFLVGTLWIIPDNTVISITLPPQAEIQGKVTPEALVQDNTIVFQGYKSSNALELNYRVWKQIASFDLQKLAQSFLNSELMVFLGVLLFVLLIIGYVKRTAIAERIEEYIVVHTELPPNENEKQG